jgi:hypothetical protein
MDESEPRAPGMPWRKRHPVVARVLLYALGGALAALLGVLFVRREQEDRVRDREALARELDDLALVHALDPDGSQVLRLLQQRFSAPDLPVTMRGRALRWRALALRKRGDRAGVEAALAEADALDLPPGERTALALERAEARLEDGDAAGAFAALPPPGPDPADPLSLLRELLLAQVRIARGEEASDVARDLRARLEALPTPLPEGPASYVGGRPWSPAEVATVLVEVLARVPGGTDAGPWRQLARLAPGDVQAQLSAARGLATQGLGEEARGALARARALDPALAAAEAAKDPVLRALASPPR